MSASSARPAGHVVPASAVVKAMESCRAVRTDAWKLVMRHPDGPHELYDMKSDPPERFNLFGQPGAETPRVELQRKLAAFFEQYADPQYDIWKGGRSKARRFTAE